LNLKEWDACAGELIAQEAGAFVKRYREDHGICILAACPGIAQQLLELVE
jgi:fructose-1,6-bisphosphatase/inositol monophosphatase family enzyme